MIIITGGAGFIGSAFAWKCNQIGKTDLLIVDDLKTSTKWKNLVGIRYADYLHKSDFIEKLNTGQIEGVQAIVHMGACSATTEEDADYLMENNYRYTRFLAEWCMENKVRFIYASSGATYGEGELGFEDDEGQLEQLRPINRYGYSKHFFDLVAKQNNWLDKIVGLKFFNVFGPNEFHKGDMRSVVCKAHRQILDTGTIKLFKSYRDDYKDGEQKRDFVYVKDCVDVMWWLIENESVNGIYNIGTSQARTWNDLANALFAALDKPANITYIDMPDQLRDQYQYFTKADTNKLNSVNCPVEFSNLEDAVRDYVVHYLNTGHPLGH